MMEATRKPTRDQSSGIIEKIVEYRFLADLTSELYRRGMDFEVLRSDVDTFGYDLALEADGVLRYVQLKASVEKGGRDEVSVNLRLASKPSGCLVWIVYHPTTFVPLRFRWLGGPPGTALPLREDAAVALRSTPNKLGEKVARANHRIVKRGHMEWVLSFRELVDKLFGPIDMPLAPGPADTPFIAAEKAGPD